MSISSVLAVSMMIGTELLRAQPPADLEPVDLRQHDVEHHQVEVLAVEALERLLAVGGRHDLVALLLERDS